jgi:SPP1 family predicted phage head-tail adaptor
MYHPGEMNERVQIIRETRTSDGAGGQTLSLTTLASVWAHVRPRSGREMERFDRVNASAMYLFVIRYRTDVEESDRIMWKGEFYNIRYIAQGTGRALYLEIDAERGVAQ